MTINLKTERYKSDQRVQVTAGSAITAGVPQQIVANSLIGIPVNDIASGAIDELDITGRFRVAKVAEVWAVGDSVGWDADGDPYNDTAGSGAYTTDEAAWDFPAGVCVQASTATEEMGIILLNEYGEGGEAGTVGGGLGETITDPGDAGAIPNSISGHVELVSAGAETRTLAEPSKVGQQLLLSFQTDGGDCVLTVATTINQTGNNTITFADAGDAVLLIGKQNGANVRWSVQMNDGAALSTV